MATTNVVDILSGVDLVPHVEELALKFATRRFIMAQRVLQRTDMEGWNVRKVSLYKNVRGAQQLAEATDIPTSKVNRARLAQIEPLEWGDRYPITDRREETDPEDIVADTIQFLGYSLGRSKEQALINTVLTGTGGNLGSSSTDYSIDLPIDVQQEFLHRFGEQREPLFHVIHPFQARKVLKDLVKFDGSNAGIALNFREQAIRGWNVPGFDGLNIEVSQMLPRKVRHRITFAASGGTFKLEIGTRKRAGVDVTANITYSGTGSTLATNIQNALNALTGQSSWTASADANDIITVQAPIFLDAESELRVATDEDGEDENDLTGTGTILFEERSASCKAPIWERWGVIHDIRKPITGYQELVNQGRTLEISAYEVYGVGLWRGDRIMTIETDCSSAFAIGNS